MGSLPKLTVYKDAGGWGSLRHSSAAHASWGVEGRGLARRRRPLVQELRGLVICAADCTQQPLALLIMASPWQPAGPALETELAGSSRQSAQLPGSPRGQAGGSLGSEKAGGFCPGSEGTGATQASTVPICRGTSHALSTSDAGWAMLGLTERLTDSCTDSQNSALFPPLSRRRKGP